MRRKRVAIFLTGGVLCLLAALSLTLYNVWDEQRAEASVQSSVELLQKTIPHVEDDRQPIVPEEQVVMDSIYLEGYNYVGVLEIPVLDLTLPILEDWSESLLRVAPCLYKGNLYDGMIIAGHNYRSHFAPLTKLQVGDQLKFTDVDGNVWSYTVATTEVIAGHDVEAMESGDWDLTLFTCTYGGRERFTVRCNMTVL